MFTLLRARAILSLVVLVVLPQLFADETEKLIPLQQLDQRPKLLENSPPEYPFAMSRAGLIGQVTVEMIIGKDGLVEDAYVASSNNPWFERPALDAVFQWKFSPGMKGGKPVKVRAVQTIEFASVGREVREYWEVSRAKDQNKLPAEFQWDEPPRAESTGYPVYPFELLQAKAKGQVRVNCIVGKNGKIIEAKLTEESAPEFGQAVLAMFNDWRFAPAKKNGQPCAALLSMRYDFSPGSDDVPVSDSAKRILKELAKSEPKIYGGNALDKPLKPVFQKAPNYPLALENKSKTGEAIIEFFIDEKGDAQLPRIVSATAPAFGYTAVQAVARWRFRPPLKEGKPVVARVRIPVKFQASKAAAGLANNKRPGAEVPGVELSTEEGRPVAQKEIYSIAEVKKVGRPPKLIKSVPPQVPRNTARHGSVQVGFVISAEGAVKSVRVISSTDKDFEQAACRAIATWKFEPAVVDGRAVAVSMEQLVEFNREGF